MENIIIQLNDRKDIELLFFNLGTPYNGRNYCLLVNYFLQPIDVLFLAQFIKLQKSEFQCNIVVQSQDGHIYNYLNRIGLIQYSIDLTAPNSREFNSLNFREVSGEGIQQYTIEIDQFFQQFCKGKDLGQLNICISELINNVYDHTDSPTGAMVFAQYYPKKDCIKVAITDLGDGIPTSVNTYFEKHRMKRLSPEEAINWAFKYRNTTQSRPANQGRGLDTVKTIIKRSGGFLWVITTEKYLVDSGAPRYYDNPAASFKGTAIQLTLYPKHLDDREIIEDLEF